MNTIRIGADVRARSAPADRESRLAVRWPSAEAFYRERDDRTVRAIGCLAPYAGRTIEIHVDPETSADATVQRVAILAANLAARWARRIRICVAADAPLVPVLARRGVTTLAERIGYEMRLADPFGDFQVGPDVWGAHAAVAGPLRLFIGPWTNAGTLFGPDDYQIHAAWWTALGCRGGSALASRVGMGVASAPATAAAAGLASALGVADLFKRAIGHAPAAWMPTFAWDTWTSALVTGERAWLSVSARSVPERLDLGNTLLAGAGAVGSAFVHMAETMPLEGCLTVFDRDAVEVTNLNRSPLFTIDHALDGAVKAVAVADYLEGRGVTVTAQHGLWREYAAALTEQPFDVWISLTNEDGAWAELPFQLPPVVLHGTTTSGWGFGSGRHIPRREDCTLCRMPRPAAQFRGRCAEGEIGMIDDRQSIRAALPFASAAAAALILAGYQQLATGIESIALPNAVSADLGPGLQAVIALRRGPTAGCHGCRAPTSAGWEAYGGRGRFGPYSAT